MQSASCYLDDLTRAVLTQTLVLVLKPVVAVGGDEEARTPGLRRAKAALSQLSYIPMSRWAWLDSNQRPLPYQRNALTG